MFSQRSALTRLVALVLPLCFVWIFTACVMICGAHAAEESKQHSIWSNSEAEISHEADCCPLTNSQLSVLPDRRSIGLELNHHLPLRVPCPWLAKARLLAPHPFPIRSSTDPPFERLVSLRI